MNEGVTTNDATSKKMFQMYALLKWTISDFSRYANLLRWSTKGELACSCCIKDTCSRWLNKGGKYCNVPYFYSDVVRNISKFIRRLF